MSNFDTISTQHWQTWRQLWYNFDTALRQFWDFFEKTWRQLVELWDHIVIISDYWWGEAEEQLGLKKNLAGICAEKQLQSAAELF